MKVVINKCFGGFGLSLKAIRRIAELQGGEGHFFEYRYGRSVPYEKRSDPMLVQVVEELGEVANGLYAELRVVEIPDDIGWEIKEYNGVESVHETHRVWE